MSNRRLKKILLTTTAFFWASCGGDSETTAPTETSDNPEKVLPDDIDGTKVDTLYGIRPVYSSGSGEISSSDGCENCDGTSSSSEFFGAPLYGDEPVFNESSSSDGSGEVTCTPTDSSVAYFATDYSAEMAKMWTEERAKHDAVDKIDSIKQTLVQSPECLEDLRMELDRFVALYGAPTIIRNAVETCSDGTTRPSEEYAKFLKMKEEWEANKPALDEERRKIYEEKLKGLEDRINKCLNNDV